MGAEGVRSRLARGWHAYTVGPVCTLQVPTPGRTWRTLWLVDSWDDFHCAFTTPYMAVAVASFRRATLPHEDCRVASQRTESVAVTGRRCPLQPRLCALVKLQHAMRLSTKGWR